MYINEKMYNTISEYNGQWCKIRMVKLYKGVKIDSIFSLGYIPKENRWKENYGKI